MLSRYFPFEVDGTTKAFLNTLDLAKPWSAVLFEWLTHKQAQTFPPDWYSQKKKRQIHPHPCHLLRTENSIFCSTWWHQIELHRFQNEWQPLWRSGNTSSVFHVWQDEKTHTQRQEIITLDTFSWISSGNHVLKWIIETKQRENNIPGVQLHLKLKLLFVCRMMKNNFWCEDHEKTRKTKDLYSCQEC